MKISIIIINYQSQEYLKRCLDSIELYLVPKLRKNNHSIETIVVDNDKTEMISLANYSFHATIVDSDHNVGFGSACNLGSQGLTSDFLLFLNPDTQLIDGSLSEMFNFSLSKPNIGIVGPQIIDSARNAPQPWTAGEKTTIWKILFRNTIKAVWKKKQATSTDWVSGTAFLIRRDLFATLGGFDENFFMYFEDQDICLRAKKINYQTYFYPKARIIHHNGKSWQNKKGQKNEYYRSQNYFFKKHGKKYEQILLSLVKNLLIT